MAYLDNTVITVDAVITKLGRERLSQGIFNITKWAVSDDEIDYSLYNQAHPLGTDYYSNIIESMPVLEALPDETQALRFKLYTKASGNSGELPSIGNVNGITGNDLGTLEWDTSEGAANNSIAIDVSSDTFNSDDTEFVFTIFNEDIVDISSNKPFVNDIQPLIEASSFANRTNTAINASKTLVKTVEKAATVSLKAKVVTGTKSTKLRISGAQTGVTKTYTITVTPV